MAAVTRSGDGVEARSVAFDVLREVNGRGAYPNIELSRALRAGGLSARDAALVTELVNGTCRLLGTYDRIIQAAAGRSLSTLQPAVVDLLRLGTHQLLSMRVPPHAAVAATVGLARARVGQRVTGVVNAILRKVSAQDMAAWLTQLTEGEDSVSALATRTHHPRWIVEAYGDVLPPDELQAALDANNVPAHPTLVCRPGVTTQDDLVSLGAQACRWSPYGATIDAPPSSLDDVRSARIGVQDEGSQLVAVALARAASADGPWLDLCAGPGGKAALLRGLAHERNATLIAADVSAHRAALVAKGMAAYDPPHCVVCADGTRPAWRAGQFAAVLADVPCTGLGALRRRPESRWRRDPAALGDLVSLQRRLLTTALAATRPGGVVAYATCSPVRVETTDIVDSVLGEHPGASLIPVSDVLSEVPGVGETMQLWPHIHNTDAMFLALVKVS